MILAIDIGNTSCKIGININHIFTSFSNCSFKELPQKVISYLDQYDVKAVAICSVSSDVTVLLDQISQRVPVFEINQNIQLPFTNNYSSATLGNDRMALVAGALGMEQEPSNILIIDAGTCVTYDFIDKEKNYYGGAISPGLHMRFKSLHTFTSKLPLIEPEVDTPVLGNSTERSIRSGVQHGLSMEIDGMIDHYKTNYKNLKVFLTGGDASLLSGLVKNRFFASPYLMLHGICNLYLFNNKI